MPFKKGQSGNPTGKAKKAVAVAEPIRFSVKANLEENLEVLFKAMARIEKIDNRTLEIGAKLLELLYCKKNHKAIEEKITAPGRVAVITYDNGRSLLKYKDEGRDWVNHEDIGAYLNARESGLLDKLKKIGVIHDDKVDVETEPELLEKLKEMGIVDKDVVTSKGIMEKAISREPRGEHQMSLEELRKSQGYH